MSKPGAKLSATLIATQLNVVLYAMCFWIQIGTLPYLTKKLDVNTITFGYLQTTFAVVQLMGGPLFGRFGDLFGSRNALMIAFASAFCSYFLLGLANTVFLVFLSRLPSVFMHAMQGAQMVITDISEPNERSNQLGKLGLFYGIGMVLGPLVGGLCTKHSSEQFAAFVAAFGSVLSIVLTYILIPPNTKKPTENESNDSKKSSAGKKILDVDLFMTLIWRNSLARYLLIIKIVSGLPIGVLHSMFSLISLNHFHLTAEVNGYVLSYIGVVSMITQGFVGKLTHWGYNDWFLIKGSIALLCLGYFVLASLVKGVASFCIALLPMVVAGAVFSTVVQSMLTKTVSGNDTGSILGISMAVHSLVRSVSPTIGAFLFQYFGFEGFGYLGVLCNGILFVYMYNKDDHPNSE